MMSLHANGSQGSIRARSAVRRSEHGEDAEGNQGGGQHDDSSRPPASAGDPGVHEREHTPALEGLALRTDKRLIIDHEPSNRGHAYLAIDWQSSLRLPYAPIPPLRRDAHMLG